MTTTTKRRSDGSTDRRQPYTVVIECRSGRTHTSTIYTHNARSAAAAARRFKVAYGLRGETIDAVTAEAPKQ